jgi:CHASE3 domain sensor protein
MHNAVVRFTLVALLIATGIGAAVFATSLQTRIEQLASRERDVASHLDRIATSVVEIGSAQQVYVVPGPHDPLMQRVSAVLGQLANETSALLSMVQSEDATRSVQAIAEAVGTLATIDDRARQNVQLGQELMASDLIANEAGPLASSMIAQVARVRAAEARALADAREGFVRQFWGTLGAVSLLWTLGLIVMARTRSAPTSTAKEPVTDAPMPPDEVTLEVEPAETATAIDLTAAAQICADISRLPTAERLPDVLGRAASVLDASGIILWMSAGEELFPVVSHGYDTGMLSRLRPIGRRTDNATASAWRTGQVRTVAGDGESNGAIVAPMFAADHCAGVLAAEVRHAREQDPTAQAVTSIFAAQLGAVIVPWPAPSVAAPSPPDSLSSIAS